MLADFDIDDAPLGEGAYGTVHKCVQKSTGRTFAIKCILIAQVRKQRHGMQQVMTEKAALIALEEHPSVVKLHYTFKDADQLYLVTELATGGALFDEIRRLGSCHISCARWLTAELVNALEFMHAKRIVHRDLKPENILLDDVGHIKLIDFGSARMLDSTEPYDTFVGTAEYLAPELLNDEECGEACDLWALGCILFQMLNGNPPFQVLGSPHLTMEAIKAWPLEYAHPETLDALPDTARKLIVELLHPNPTQRLGAPGSTVGEYATLREHAFFTTGEPPIDFDELTSTPPPPLAPPPPLPSILGDGSVLNGQLARRGPLPPADRAILLEAQARVRWSTLLDKSTDELLILATLITKRRHLSAKRRQLILAEGLVKGAPPAAPSSAVDITDTTADGDASVSMPSSCRLFYVDPVTMEAKGSIPWSAELRAELLPKGQFRVHTPGRTYHLEDASGDSAVAELWVQTICSLQARRSVPVHKSTPNLVQDSQRSFRDD